MLGARRRGGRDYASGHIGPADAALYLMEELIAPYRCYRCCYCCNVLARVIPAILTPARLEVTTRLYRG